MRSLILFLVIAQVTAAFIFFFVELRGADDPAAMAADFGLPLRILAAAVILGFFAVYLGKWAWSRAFGLLLALVLPILFVAHDLGLSWG